VDDILFSLKSLLEITVNMRESQGFITNVMNSFSTTYFKHFSERINA